MIVIDASVAVKWIAEEDFCSEALALTNDDETLIAPDFVILETLNVLRRKLRDSQITETQLRRATEVLPGTFDLLLPAVSFSTQSVDLALKLDHSVYDCAYLACAIQQNARLVTADQKFAKKVVVAGYGNHVVELGPSVVQSLRASGASMPVEERVLQLWGVFDQTLLHVCSQVGRPVGNFDGVFYSPLDLRPAFESPSYLRLQRFIEGLDREQLIKLQALAWFGRSYIHEDWKTIFDQAERHVSTADSGLIKYIISNLGTLSKGIEKLRSSGNKDQ